MAGEGMEGEVQRGSLVVTERGNGLGKGRMRRERYITVTFKTFPCSHSHWNSCFYSIVTEIESTLAAGYRDTTTNRRAGERDR